MICESRKCSTVQPNAIAAGPRSANLQRLPIARDKNVTIPYAIWRMCCSGWSVFRARPVAGHRALTV
jgi:hypothetical protein